MENYTKSLRLLVLASLLAIAVQQLIYGAFLPVILPAWPFTLHNNRAAGGASGLLIVLIVRAAFGSLRKKARPHSLQLGYLLLLMFIIFQLPYQLLNNPGFLGGWTNPLKLLAYAGGVFIITLSMPPGDKSTGSNMFEKILPMGRFFFAFTMFVFGIEHFVYPAFVAMLVPAWIPFHLFWTYFAGLALIVSGMAIMLNIRLRLAANLLGVMILIWLIVLHIPRAIADPYSGNGNELTSVFEALGFSSIAFLLAATARKA